ncbi:hypothetical protein GCM10027174_38810 [Salinifilum aidingensis]
MSVTDLWTRIVRWLTDHAPVTGGALRSPLSPPVFGSLEAELGTQLPAELREWWKCCDGTSGDVLADVLPPFYTPYGAAKAMDSWRAHRYKRGAARETGDSCAGAACTGFHPAWIPIAGDGFSDELLVDLRPGRLHGCVVEWEHEAGQVHRPEWSGVGAMLTDVHRSLSEGTPAGHAYPTVTEDGRLDWQIR